MLSLLHHPNLVNLIGYCADGDQRVLVYEYMPRGSLEDHLIGKELECGKCSLWFGNAVVIESVNVVVNFPKIRRFAFAFNRFVIRYST